MSGIPRLVLTPGEPAGIGPDITVLLARLEHPACLLAVADPAMLRERARMLGVALDIDIVDSAAQCAPHSPGRLAVLPVELAHSARPGRLDPANARYVLQTLEQAAALCRDGVCGALVTGPVNKATINDAGIDFDGHTGFLAGLTGARHPVMMLATSGLRVALASVHIPLSQVSTSLTREGLTATLTVLEHDLRHRFGIGKPRILVAGLNPHAGEGGYLGREEIDIIEPVLAELRASGMELTGPLPADTLFTPKQLAGTDAVLAMYHDQGLPVIKHLGFGRTVNVTLGLPIIRTSVDHGTAVDRAGNGDVDTGSLEAAVAMAAELASNKNKW